MLVVLSTQNLYLCTYVAVLNGSISNLCINSSRYPTSNPTASPTILPPTIQPTPSPIDCLSRTDDSLNVSALSEWNAIVFPNTAEADTFTVVNSSNECYATNPCIAIQGITGNGEKDEVFIEQTLDVSAFINIRIGLEAATFSFDTVEEYAFFESLCDSNEAQRTRFHAGVTELKRYSGCFDFNVESCHTFTLRVGGVLGGTKDKIYVTQVILQFTAPTSSPMSIPTTFPSSYSTQLCMFLHEPSQKKTSFRQTDTHQTIHHGIQQNHLPRQHKIQQLNQ